MNKYVVFGRENKVLCVRYRGQKTLDRFPGFNVITYGLAKSMHHAKRLFNELKLSNNV